MSERINKGLLPPETKIGDHIEYRCKQYVVKEQDIGPHSSCWICDEVVAAPACTAVAVPLPVEHVQVMAESQDEMILANQTLIQWAKVKIESAKVEARELKEAVRIAIKSKYKASTLKRHAEKAVRRLDFYERFLTALEHGYHIVPNFPFTAFAIRTDRQFPLRIVTTDWRVSHEQKPGELPAGEGEYKNPFPIVHQKEIAPPTATKAATNQYWVEMWKDVEFPVVMAKPRIMDAADRAMALKIFDEIGILPSFTNKAGGRPPRGDPMILASLIVPDTKSGYYYTPRRVTFIIAWMFDTKSI